jgi:hypothetical protein
MANQLPAYLQKSQLPRLADRATEGMGSSLPPRVSIRSNMFTLIDATGQEQEVPTRHLDCNIVDMSDVMCKLYYGREYAEGAADAPLCFSANGVAPSRDAQQPQSQTCASCPQNVRGSAISKLSGVAIKACRDEKWLAITTSDTGDMVFQIRITPGSFQNWKAYNEKFKNQPLDIRDVTTRLQFEAKKNGVLTFTPTGYISEATSALRSKLLEAKATDAYVGRTDVPIGATLAAPASVANTPFLAAPAAAASPGPSTTESGPATKPARGRPRKSAETQQEQAPTESSLAPFRPATPPSNGGPFMQPAAEPPQEITQQLDSFFGK